MAKLKFRKRPVIIEAEQYLPGNPLPAGVTVLHQELIIQTLEGNMKVSPGDWVITGVHGEQYPCKPDIFEKTYEPVPEVKTGAEQPGRITKVEQY